MPISSVNPAWVAMILLRTMTSGMTFRNFIPSRSRMPIRAPVVTDWIQSLA